MGVEKKFILCLGFAAVKGKENLTFHSLYYLFLLNSLLHMLILLIVFIAECLNVFLHIIAYQLRNTGY